MGERRLKSIGNRYNWQRDKKSPHNTDLQFIPIAAPGYFPLTPTAQ